MAFQAGASGDYPMDAYTPDDFFSEGTVKPSQSGQALCLSQNGGSSLVPAKMDFKKTHYPAFSTDMDTPDIQGCPSDSKPAFFLAGERFKNGPITSIGQDIPLENTKELNFESKTYRLALKKLSPMWYAIDLSRDGQTQRLVRRYNDSRYLSPIIEWAGDLDRDGKLDFMLNYELAEGGTARARTLFLSSYAGKDELVKPVSRFAWWLCWTPKAEAVATA